MPANNHAPPGVAAGSSNTGTRIRGDSTAVSLIWSRAISQRRAPRVSQVRTAFAPLPSPARRTSSIRDAARVPSRSQRAVVRIVEGGGS